MKLKKIKFLFPVIFLVHFASSQTTERSVFHDNQGSSGKWLTYQDNHRALYKIITNEAFRQLDERSEKISSLSSAEEWKSYQTKIKSSLCQPLEKFKKTPLNARTTGTLERETFTVEKVIFESHPGFYVTAGLFLPKQRENPSPAIIYCCGHTDLGFRSETYQQIIINLVNKGFIVLAFDPIGQGERNQYPDKDSGMSKIGSPTQEHSYAGIQTLLTGSAITDYFIWDGIRVVDYLETRPEVDMNRIGINGRSGGGTQTAQIAACDARIYAAVPENYITNFKRLLQAIGPQDAEQNPYNAIANGFDHPDYLNIRAPKPTLMITTTHDYFSIQGARETFSEGKKSYTAAGSPENLQMVEDFGRHQSTQKNRETLYAFFQKHLNLPGDPTDYPVTPFSLKELWVTPTGQIGTSFECETIYTLNKKYFPGKNLIKSDLARKVKQTAGIDFKRKITSAVYTGKFFENDIEVEKYFIENEWNDYALPVYILKDKNNSSSDKGKLVVWFHQEGKEKILNDPLLAEILKSGYLVVSVDLPGTGELRDPEFSGDGEIKSVPFNYTFGANLIGKSIPGIQAEAIDLLRQYIDQDSRFKNMAHLAIVQGTAASPFLHFSVLNNTFSKAAFYNFPEPVETLIEEEYYNPSDAFTAVPGSLLFYDLPDLTTQLSETGTKVYIHKLELNTSSDKISNSGIIDFFEK